MSYAYSYLPTGQDKLPPRSYHKWNMDVKLPQGGQWINPEVPTQFVVEKCTDCGLRIVFCLGQNEQYFFPNNSKCSMSYSFEEIFGAKAEESSKSEVRGDVPLIPIAHDVLMHQDNQRELIERKVNTIYQPVEWNPQAHPRKEYKPTSGKFKEDDSFTREQAQLGGIARWANRQRSAEEMKGYLSRKARRDRKKGK